MGNPKVPLLNSGVGQGGLTKLSFGWAYQRYLGSIKNPFGGLTEVLALGRRIGKKGLIQGKGQNYSGRFKFPKTKLGSGVEISSFKGLIPFVPTQLDPTGEPGGRRRFGKNKGLKRNGLEKGLKIGPVGQLVSKQGGPNPIKGFKGVLRKKGLIPL